MVEDEILVAWELRNRIFMMKQLLQAIWSDLCVWYSIDFQRYMNREVAALSDSGTASEEAPGEPSESGQLPGE
jgi:hypothetical protein